MANEITVLKAVKTIMESGTYGTDIHGFYVRPDDLLNDFQARPNFCTIGLTEDVPKVYDYSDLSNQMVSYSITIRFFLCEGLIEIGSSESLQMETVARVVSAEAARLLFANPYLSGTAVNTGSITSTLVQMFLRDVEYTGVEVDMPVSQEI